LGDSGPLGHSKASLPCNASSRSDFGKLLSGALQLEGRHGPMMNNWSDEETNEPLLADHPITTRWRSGPRMAAGRNALCRQQPRQGARDLHGGNQASAAHTTDYRMRVLDEWSRKTRLEGPGLQLSTTVDRLCFALPTTPPRRSIARALGGLIDVIAIR
jgi:hypothetical protein